MWTQLWSLLSGLLSGLLKKLMEALSGLHRPFTSQPPPGWPGGPLERELERCNTVASEEAKRLLSETGDCLPNCDLSVWLRDCQTDIEVPILPSHVEGEVPDWLDGTLVRNGPGQQSFGSHKFKHLFDCSAVLHRFEVKEGKCNYQNKLLKSSTYLKNKAAERIVVTEFGTAAVPDPCQTIFQRVKAVFEPEQTDNCMISVYPWGDKLYAMTETTVMYQIDPSTLDTLDKEDLSRRVGVVHHSSHPHVTEDGSVHYLGLCVGPTGPHYTVVRFPPGAEMMASGEVVCRVRCRWPLHPSYMHSFGLTDHYYVILEQPLTVSVPTVFASRLSPGPPPTHAALRWLDDQPTLVHVVERATGLRKTFQTERLFFLHVINQFEEGDTVVVDLCAYRDPSMIDCMYLDALRGAHCDDGLANRFRGRPVRLRARLGDAAGGTQPIILPELLCSLGCETPRILYPDLLGRPYTYFYAISSDVDLTTPGTLIKVDTVRGSWKTWCEEGSFPSEPIFVPRKDRKSEDDGVVLSALLWCKDPRKVSLLVLDGASFTQLARITFTAPCPVPKCLHGWFLPSSSS